MFDFFVCVDLVDFVVCFVFGIVDKDVFDVLGVCFCNFFV